MPARSSFPRELSLKNQADIRKLFRRGRRISGRYCSLIWEVGESSAFGIFLSKAHGKAARRNRIKRLYREALRFNQRELSRPVRVAVLPDAACGTIGFSEINGEIQRLLREIDDRCRPRP